MADIIQIEYDQMRQLASTFQEQTTQTRNILNTINAQVQVLRGGGWIADAATKFYREMDDTITPGITRLINALTDANQITNEVSGLMEKGEQEAGSCLNITD